MQLRPAVQLLLSAAVHLQCKAEQHFIVSAVWYVVQEHLTSDSESPRFNSGCALIYKKILDSYCSWV